MCLGLVSDVLIEGVVPGALVSSDCGIVYAFCLMCEVFV